MLEATMQPFIEAALRKISTETDKNSKYLNIRKLHAFIEMDLTTCRFQIIVKVNLCLSMRVLT